MKSSSLLRRLLDATPPSSHVGAMGAAGEAPSTMTRTAVSVARFRRRVAKRRGLNRALGGAVRVDSFEQHRPAPVPVVVQSKRVALRRARVHVGTGRKAALTRVFGFYGSLFDPRVALDNKQPSFDQIKLANETLTFAELHQLLVDFEVVPQLINRTKLQSVWVSPHLTRRIEGRIWLLERAHFATALALCALLIAPRSSSSSSSSSDATSTLQPKEQLALLAKRLLLDHPAAQKQRIVTFGSLAQDSRNLPKSRTDVNRRRAEMLSLIEGTAAAGSASPSSAIKVPRGSVRDLHHFLRKSEGALTPAEADAQRARLELFHPAQARSLETTTASTSSKRAANAAAAVPETAGRRRWVPLKALQIDAGTLAPGEVRRNAFMLRITNDGKRAARARLWTTAPGVVVECAEVVIPPHEKRDVAVHIFPPQLSHGATRTIAGEITIAVGAADEEEPQPSPHLIAAATTIQCPLLMVVQRPRVDRGRERFAQAKCRCCSNARLFHVCPGQGGPLLIPKLDVTTVGSKVPIKTSIARKIHDEVPAPPPIAATCPTPLHASMRRREERSNAGGGPGGRPRRARSPLRDETGRKPPQVKPAVRWSGVNEGGHFGDEGSGSRYDENEGGRGAMPQRLGAEAIEPYNPTFSARHMLVTPHELLTFSARPQIASSVAVREIVDVRGLVEEFRKHGRQMSTRMSTERYEY